MLIERGLVFNQFRNLLFYQTEWFDGLSDVVLSTARSASAEPDRITADLQLFKKIRSDCADDPDYFFKMLFKYAPELEARIQVIDAAKPPEDVGGWWLISIIKDQLTSGVEKPLSGFWDKLSELCQDERLLIQQDSQDIRNDEINRLGAKWLDMDCLPDVKEGAKYLVRIVLTWLAIYEHILREVTPGFDEFCPGPAYFRKFLPKYMDGKLLLSNAQFCIAYKEKHASGPQKNWSNLYARVAEAQGENSVEKIKKAIEQIRSGKRNLLWTNYRDNFRVLVPELNGEAFDEIEMIVLFCQLMTKVQLELLQHGFTEGQIDRLFSFYPDAYNKFTV